MIDGINEVVNGIMQSAEDKADGKREHIGADGLTYCDECGEPTQCIVNVFGYQRTVHCMCRCDKEKREQEIAEIKRQEHINRIYKLRANGFESEEMKRWTFRTDDGKQPNVMKTMKAYVVKFDEMKARGKGLMLYGGCGSGKTFAAACVANALIDNGIPVLMTNFSRITNRLQASFEGRQEYIDSFNNFDLLIIDDLASERQTEYMNEIVYSVIDARYRAGLPLIVTTNLDLRAMSSEMELSRKRIYSRVMQMCFPIAVEGADRRLQNALEQNVEIEQLLGIREHPKHFSQSSIDLSEAESLINKF